MEQRTAKLTDFRPDPKNANRGTARGLKVLDNSVGQYGAGRSLLADRNGTLIAGNKTQDRLIDHGIEDAIVVESDGTKAVVVVRTDLDLANDPDGRARALATYDNRAGELDLEWDADALADLDDGLLKDLFTDKEYELITLLQEEESRPTFDDVIEEFSKPLGARGKSAKDGNWLYVEYYGDNETFAEVSELIKPGLASEHCISSQFFLDVLRKALGHG